MTFFYLWFKHRLWVLVRTAFIRRFWQAPTIFLVKKKNKLMYTPPNPTFPCIKWGFKGCLQHRLVNVMYSLFKTDAEQESFNSFIFESNPLILLSVKSTAFLKTLVFVNRQVNVERQTSVLTATDPVCFRCTNSTFSD